MLGKALHEVKIVIKRIMEETDVNIQKKMIIAKSLYHLLHLFIIDLADIK